MAEAAETPQLRYFCHFCKRETTPKLPVSHAELCRFTLAVHLCEGRARMETFRAHPPPPLNLIIIIIIILIIIIIKLLILWHPRAKTWCLFRGWVQHPAGSYIRASEWVLNAMIHVAIYRSATVGRRNEGFAGGRQSTGISGPEVTWLP